MNSLPFSDAFLAENRQHGLDMIRELFRGGMMMDAADELAYNHVRRIIDGIPKTIMVSDIPSGLPYEVTKNDSEDTCNKYTMHDMNTRNTYIISDRLVHYSIGATVVVIDHDRQRISHYSTRHRDFSGPMNLISSVTMADGGVYLFNSVTPFVNTIPGNPDHEQAFTCAFTRSAELSDIPALDMFLTRSNYTGCISDRRSSWGDQSHNSDYGMLLSVLFDWHKCDKTADDVGYAIMFNDEVTFIDLGHVMYTKIGVNGVDSFVIAKSDNIHRASCIWNDTTTLQRFNMCSTYRSGYNHLSGPNNFKTSCGEGRISLFGNVEQPRNGDAGIDMSKFYVSYTKNKYKMNAVYCSYTDDFVSYNVTEDMHSIKGLYQTSYHEYNSTIIIGANAHDSYNSANSMRISDNNRTIIDVINKTDAGRFRNVSVSYNGDSKGTKFGAIQESDVPKYVALYSRQFANANDICDIIKSFIYLYRGGVSKFASSYTDYRTAMIRNDRQDTTFALIVSWMTTKFSSVEMNMLVNGKMQLIPFHGVVHHISEPSRRDTDKRLFEMDIINEVLVCKFATHTIPCNKNYTHAAMVNACMDIFFDVVGTQVQMQQAAFSDF